MLFKITSGGIMSVVPQDKVLYTLYISRGFYFREFNESGAIREINNTLKYSLQFHYH